MFFGIVWQIGLLFTFIGGMFYVKSFIKESRYEYFLKKNGYFDRDYSDSTRFNFVEMIIVLAFLWFIGVLFAIFLGIVEWVVLTVINIW